MTYGGVFQLPPYVKYIGTPLRDDRDKGKKKPNIIKTDDILNE